MAYILDRPTVILVHILAIDVDVQLLILAKIFPGPTLRRNVMAVTYPAERAVPFANSLSAESMMGKRRGNSRASTTSSLSPRYRLLRLVAFARRGLKKPLQLTWVQNAAHCSAVKGCSQFLFAVQSLASCWTKHWMKSA